jgi:spermidine synthase
MLLIDYIPEHLMTAEFLEEINTLLSPEGILTANTFSSSKLYGYESATYKKIFGDFYQVTNANNNNRIILAQKNGFTMANLIKDHQSMQSNRKFSKKLANIGVDSQSLYLNIKFTGEHQDWNDDSIILTDQFSPANLLNLESD